ncbi:OmpA/MotB family protein [Flavobacterium pallidum]|uniref:Cell envelope biogenesis protein OmpA n=1 Tax=Flavobacterium pallidum TaxID=2172098 RepID=A0A2S1SF46_9FLAO|nr:OmpA family protein [Flavobacterium pallidum]AWI25036.1 cell envelope biogenesis protein OmpA [Flavobacterium pallidum]
MIKKVSAALLIMALSSSCVSKKVYTDLENKFADLKKESRKMADDNEALLADKNKLEIDQSNLQKEYDKTKSERDKLQADLAAANANMKTLQASYSALEKNSDDALQSNMTKNRELLAKLEAKEKALAAEQERINKLMADFQERSNRVTELEEMMASKEAGMKKLKETLSKALNAFEGKGLTIEQKNGKVYVSMENKLLFQTGSWTVGAEGKKAVTELGKVLAQNPEIAVLIEGHTDNDKFAGAVGGIENNWDLSTKRATAVVNILSENKGINKQNLTAAGRGEFAPIASNDNTEGKSKNRRIEIILTPKLDEISKMLNDL